MTTETTSPADEQATTVDDSADLGGYMRWGLACLSLGAGAIHLSMISTHWQHYWAYGLFFAVVAWAQIAWGVSVLLRPSRGVLIAGVVGNLAVLGTWVMSRTVGVLVGPGASTTEPVEYIDLLSSTFEALIVVGAAVLLSRTVARKRTAPMAGFSAVALTGVAVVILSTMAFTPSLAGSHGGGGDAAHGDHHGTGSIETAAATSDDHGEHADGQTTDAADHATDHATGGTSGHDGHDMPERLNHEPTDEQLADAQLLIDDTKQATAKYADLNMAKAAGYQSIGDGRSGFEHYVNAAYTANETILDPSQPESLVYKVLPDGGREFTTVMYILSPGSTMDDVPDVAGNLTMWHGHDTLCFEPGSVRIAGVVRNGTCFPKGLPGTSPMLHVWVTPNDCGPFAGTDAGQMTGSCVNEGALS